jgi:hypothetical protein
MFLFVYDMIAVYSTTFPSLQDCEAGIYGEPNEAVVENECNSMTTIF